MGLPSWRTSDSPRRASTPSGATGCGGQGKGAARPLDDAQALELAGAFAIVLEMVPEQVARDVTATLGIPTIGIGAGNGASPFPARSTFTA